MRDWNTLPPDRATTMLRVYELLDWPAGLLVLPRQRAMRWWRQWRRRLRHGGRARADAPNQWEQA